MSGKGWPKAPFAETLPSVYTAAATDARRGRLGAVPACRARSPGGALPGRRGAPSTPLGSQPSTAPMIAG